VNSPACTCRPGWPRDGQHFRGCPAREVDGRAVVDVVTPDFGMPPGAASAWLVEEKRHIAAVVAFVAKFPECRSHASYALLGSAIATCDSYGIDVEAFLTELRARFPKPAVLVPPKSTSS
jgi:hypothetical protein